MRTMYDSVTAGDAPNGANLYADYLDIAYSHDPRATIHICRDGNRDEGDVLDTGEGVPNQQAPTWVAMRRKTTGTDKTIYTNYANWSALRQEFAKAGVPQPQWWIAWYTNDQATISRVFSEGAVAVQHANPPLTGGHYDASLVLDHWPGVDSTPAPGVDDLNDHDVRAILDTALVAAEAMKSPPDRTVTPWRPDIDAAQQARLQSYKDGTRDLETLVHEIMQGYGGL